MDKHKSTILQNGTKIPEKENETNETIEIKIRSHVRLKCCETRTEFPLTK